MTTIPSPPEFTFTPSDVRLKITYKGAPAYAHVSSHAMALASPVWKNFLFPPWFREPDGEIDLAIGRTPLSLNPVKELDFSEDDAEALLVLLCIAHLRFEYCLNKQPPKQVFIDIAILCDAYFCQALVRPWLAKWLRRSFKKQILDWRTHQSDMIIMEDWKDLVNMEDNMEMILIGWVFGRSGGDRIRDDSEGYKLQEVRVRDQAQGTDPVDQLEEQDLADGEVKQEYFEEEYFMRGVDRILDLSIGPQEFPPLWPLLGLMGRFLFHNLNPYCRLSFGVEKIMAARDAFISDVVTRLYARLTELEEGIPDVCPNHPQDTCKTTVIDRYKQKLGTLGLWPRMTPEKAISFLSHRHLHDLANWEWSGCDDILRKNVVIHHQDDYWDSIIQGWKAGRERLYSDLQTSFRKLTSDRLAHEERNVSRIVKVTGEWIKLPKVQSLQRHSDADRVYRF